MPAQPARLDRLSHLVVQANAVSDKLLDLRKCKLHGADLHGKTLSGGIFVEADMSGSNLVEAVFSKAYAVQANFSGGFRCCFISYLVFSCALPVSSYRAPPGAILPGPTFASHRLRNASSAGQRLCQASVHLRFKCT